MIFGYLDSFDASQCGHKGVAAALAWAASCDLTALEAGRHEIDGDSLFCNFNQYQTKPVDDCRFEAHKRYIDVHVMAAGQELIDSQDISLLEADPFDDEADFTLADGSTAVRVKLVPGSFAVYFPQDAHKPGVAVDDAPSLVSKAVIKVAF